MTNGLDFPLAFQKFLDQNWLLLAATAYRGYLSQGRGLIWVDWLNQLPITTPISEVGVIYATPTSKVTRAIWPSGMSEGVQRMVRRYPPGSAIVVYWTDGEISRARTVAIAGSVSPQQAYQQMKGQLPEFEVDLCP